MSKKLVRDLVAVVISQNTHSIYDAVHGWNGPFEHSCGLCKSKWQPGKPEKHKTTCVIARAYKVTSQKPRILPIRPL